MKDNDNTKKDNALCMGLLRNCCPQKQTQDAFVKQERAGETNSLQGVGEIDKSQPWSVIKGHYWI